MKLCTFAVQTPLGAIRRVGIATTDCLIDATAARAAFLERNLTAAAAERVACAQVPADMLMLIGSGRAAMQWADEAVKDVLQRGSESTAFGQTIRYAPEAVTLLAPLPRPAAIVNFSVWPAHAAGASAMGITLKPNESGAAVKPYWKGNPDAVTAPATTLECPVFAESIDVECELVCVVGTGGRDLDLTGAEQAIVGYTIMNDVSARERQAEEMKSGRGPSKGKDFDSAKPMGPWLVTSDEIEDVRDVRMSLHINGQEMSSCGASGMIWSFPEMLSYLSIGQTVQPGTVISGGCYSGGSAHEVGVQLKAGDIVEMRVSGIGGLTNTIGGRPGIGARRR